MPQGHHGAETGNVDEEGVCGQNAAPSSTGGSNSGDEVYFGLRHTYSGQSSDWHPTDRERDDGLTSKPVLEIGGSNSGGDADVANLTTSRAEGCVEDSAPSSGQDGPGTLLKKRALTKEFRLVPLGPRAEVA